jgi:hypothetical protein
MFACGTPPADESRIQARPDGVLEQLPEAVVAVEVARDGSTSRFRRRGARWWNAGTAEYCTEAQTTSLEQAMKIMHASAPVRILRPEDIAGLSAQAFGLDPPALRVRLSTNDGLVLAANFGDRASDGVLQYLRVEGHGETYLMSGFVGESWVRLSEREAPVATKK